MESPRSLFYQLRDRKMVQVLVVYLAAAWGLAQVAEFVVDNYGLSRRFLDVTLLLLILGIPAAAVIAWFHGEKGDQRTTRFEVAILTTLMVLGAIGTYRISTAAIPLELIREAAVIDLGDQSVAVLPFQVSIQDPEFDWMSEGIAALLATGLKAVPSLRVVATQRLFDLLRERGQEDARTIPNELASTITIAAGARFMVTGEVLGSSQDMVINARLVDVETGEVAAAARVRGSDAFTLVDSVSAALSSQVLGATISPTEMTSVASITTGNLEAYREYQLGVEAQRRFHYDEAFEHIERAVALDPTFALAQLHLSGLAMSQGRISLGVTSLQAARDNRDAAPERDRLFIDAMVAGIVENDNEKSSEILTDLVRQYPDDKQARAALWSLYPGQSDERREHLEQAIHLDPMYAHAYNELAYWHARKGNFDAADSLISRYVELEPGEPNPLDSKGEILEQAGRTEEARSAYRAALEIQPDFTFSLDHLARTYLLEGRPADGRRELEPWTRSDLPQTRARALALTGDAYMDEGLIEEGLHSISQGAEVAREAENPDLEAQILLTLLPAYMAVQDFNSLTTTSTRVRELDPLNPIPPVAMLAALGEQGRLDALDALASEIRTRISASASLEQFLPLIEAGLSLESAFYRGDYDSAAAWGDSVLSRGGLPMVGNHSYVRALLEVDRGEDALRRARRIAGEARSTIFRGYFPIFMKQSHYYQARAHELLGDTAAAINEYEMLLTNWSDAVREVPAIADAPERLATLKAN